MNLKYKEMRDGGKHTLLMGLKNNLVLKIISEVSKLPRDIFLNTPQG